MNKIFTVENYGRAKNVLLAAFIFGSVGAYMGAQFVNQENARISAAVKAAVPTAQASTVHPK